MTSTQPRTADLISRYMVQTKEILPQMARDPAIKWPVRHDHCFRRIVLDNVCGGPWFKHLPMPAYKSLSYDQARHAVQLCEDIIAHRVDLHELNRRSLIWRGKQVR